MTSVSGDKSTPVIVNDVFTGAAIEFASGTASAAAAEMKAKGYVNHLESTSTSQLGFLQ